MGPGPARLALVLASIVILSSCAASREALSPGTAARSFGALPSVTGVCTKASIGKVGRLPDGRWVIADGRRRCCQAQARARKQCLALYLRHTAALRSDFAKVAQAYEKEHRRRMASERRRWWWRVIAVGVGALAVGGGVGVLAGWAVSR